MLVRGRTSRLPGHNEMRYIRGGVATPPPRKAKATMNCRASVVCLVTVHVSCLDTATVSGAEIPPGPPSLKHRLFAQSQYLSRAWPQQPVSGLDTAAVPGENPTPDPPSSTPLGTGSHILSRAWTQQPCRRGTPPRTPPSTTLPRAWT